MGCVEAKLSLQALVCHSPSLAHSLSNTPRQGCIRLLSRCSRCCIDSTDCIHRPVCCITSVAHIIKLWTLLGYMTVFHMTCIKWNMLNFWKVQMLDFRGKKNLWYNLRQKWDLLQWSVSLQWWLYHRWGVRIIKAESIALISQRQVLPLFLFSSFFSLSWWRIDLNLMMFVMKCKSQTNYIKELWSPVPCLTEHVMIWWRLEQPPI